MKKYESIFVGSYSDCTTSYKYKFNEDISVKDFIEAESEYNNFVQVSIIFDGNKIFDKEVYVETKGRNAEPIPDVYANHTILKATSNGGYGNTHYYVWIANDIIKVDELLAAANFLEYSVADACEYSEQRKKVLDISKLLRKTAIVINKN